MNALVAILGPTGTGKTELSLSLAGSFHLEVVNADSRQVYRYMDIGAAKPTPEQQSRARHHLLDMANPDQDFSLALYHDMACTAIADVQRRGKLPLLVGGTGQYAWSVIEGWQAPRVPPDKQLREHLETRSRTEGPQAIYLELLRLDPTAANRIDPRNVRRVIRALEVCIKTGQPFSQLQRKSPPTYPVLIIGLTMERVQLYQRVDSRVDNMIQRGLPAEVKRLVEMGYGLDLPAMSGVGYRQIGLYLQGKWDLETAIRQTKFATHRFIRRQYAWFRLSDGRIHWLNAHESVEERSKELVAQFLEKREDRHE
ncbi:MAG: tRNA (adenosine(37)-N6)-dimethylallyltransferase MiaA [Chloroflexi bacterium]|nr:tRNA (adenosine(37)-N6)-dimethylallyltransferase MiaA [Chloroflexota bacterium]